VLVAVVAVLAIVVVVDAGDPTVSFDGVPSVVPAHGGLRS
jgi:hypothetical protein